MSPHFNSANPGLTLRGGLRFFLLLTLGLALSLASARAGGVVANCSGVSGLEAAMAGGGRVTFTCSGTIPIATPFTIFRDTTIDGSGQAVVLASSGSGSSRLFNLNPGVRLTLLNVTLANGLSTNAGAILNDGGTLILTNCVITNCVVLGLFGQAGSNGQDQGGVGNNGDGGQNGSSAIGGAVLNTGTMIAHSSTFVFNNATGGNGGLGGDGGDGGFAGGHGGDGGSGGAALGGAIYNTGNLLLLDCTFDDNSVSGGDGALGGDGGNIDEGRIKPGFPGQGGAGAAGSGAALYNVGTATVQRCTFVINAARGGDSAEGGTSRSSGRGQEGRQGGGSQGGGIFNLGALQLLNSTFSRNQAEGGTGGDGGPSGFVPGDGGNGGDASGGNLYNAGAGTITNCTLSAGAAIGGTNGLAGTSVFPAEDGERGQARGGNLADDAGGLLMVNTIIDASSSGANVSGQPVDLGHNLSSDGSAGFTHPASLGSVDPLLGTLQDNGGLTLTLSLRPGSPALDAGDDAACPLTDQRSFLRPRGLHCDIGAYESLGTPVITNQPVNQTAGIGSTATFTVGAEGEPFLGFQWFFGNTELPGGFSSSLVISNVATNNAGSYYAVVANNYGATTSSVVTLTVVDALHFEIQPTNQTVGQGSDVTFQSLAASIGMITYQWQFVGTNMAGATNLIAATNASLLLTNVQVAQAGGYRVLASSGGTTITSVVAQLTVNTPPVFTSQPLPESQTVMPGEFVGIAAEVAGAQPIGFQWFKDGLELPGETNSFILIDSVDVSHQGTYTVVASNIVGSTLSAPAILTVNGAAPPVFTAQPAGLLVGEGANATLTAAASSPTPITYLWHHDGAPMPTATNATLTLTGVSSADSGAYSLRAANAGGSTMSSSAQLIVIVPPQLLEASYAGGTFTLKVQSSEGRSYLLEGTDGLNPSSWSVLSSQPGNGGKLTFHDSPAVSGRYYRVRVE